MCINDLCERTTCTDSAGCSSANDKAGNLFDICNGTQCLQAVSCSQGSDCANVNKIGTTGALNQCKVATNTCAKDFSCTTYADCTTVFDADNKPLNRCDNTTSKCVRKDCTTGTACTETDKDGATNFDVCNGTFCVASFPCANTGADCSSTQKGSNTLNQCKSNSCDYDVACTNDTDCSNVYDVNGKLLNRCDSTSNKCSRTDCTSNTACTATGKVGGTATAHNQCNGAYCVAVLSCTNGSDCKGAVDNSGNSAEICDTSANLCVPSVTCTNTATCTGNNDQSVDNLVLNYCQDVSGTKTCTVKKCTASSDCAGTVDEANTAYDICKDGKCVADYTCTDGTQCRGVMRNTTALSHCDLSTSKCMEKIACANSAACSNARDSNDKVLNRCDSGFCANQYCSQGSDCTASDNASSPVAFNKCKVSNNLCYDEVSCTSNSSCTTAFDSSNKNLNMCTSGTNVCANKTCTNGSDCTLTDYSNNAFDECKEGLCYERILCSSKGSECNGTSRKNGASSVNLTFCRGNVCEDDATCASSSDCSGTYDSNDKPLNICKPISSGSSTYACTNQACTNGEGCRGVKDRADVFFDRCDGSYCRDTISCNTSDLCSGDERVGGFALTVCDSGCVAPKFCQTNGDCSGYDANGNVLNRCLNGVCYGKTCRDGYDCDGSLDYSGESFDVCDTNQGPPRCVAKVTCGSSVTCKGITDHKGRRLNRCENGICSLAQECSTGANCGRCDSNSDTAFNQCDGKVCWNQISCNSGKDCAGATDKTGTALAYCRSGQCTDSISCTSSSNCNSLTDSTGKTLNMCENKVCVSTTCTTSADCTKSDMGGNKFNLCDDGICVQGSNCTSSSHCRGRVDSAGNATPNCTNGKCTRQACTTQANCDQYDSYDNAFNMCDGKTCFNSIPCTTGAQCTGGKDATGKDLTTCRYGSCRVAPTCTTDSDCNNYIDANGNELSRCDGSACVNQTCTTGTECTDTNFNKCDGKMCQKEIDCSTNADCSGKTDAAGKALNRCGSDYKCTNQTCSAGSSCTQKDRTGKAFNKCQSDLCVGDVACTASTDCANVTDWLDRKLNSCVGGKCSSHFCRTGANCQNAEDDAKVDFNVCNVDNRVCATTSCATGNECASLQDNNGNTLNTCNTNTKTCIAPKSCSSNTDCSGLKGTNDQAMTCNSKKVCAVDDDSDENDKGSAALVSLASFVAAFAALFFF
eukprot:CAMPEP_0115042982 /NCGR_PEP_ID=MMETSP0216-20121206/46592_1 /TAXON_ID=223996 /ORGANISM="Protocruzia adherens, Strain Boccale" /LENGTH=1203 /DNA_ID=CAMNT_0002425205 /DNA_START=261 /DNA_END=3872 /DNA_ORIENTATION=+